MKNPRIHYFVLLLLIIFLGIVSRKIPAIPLCTGDMLYTVMIYVLIRALFINKKPLTIAVIALTICFCIEFSQLYKSEWVLILRKTLLGKYILGQGFLWTDLIAYTSGAVFAFLIEKIILKYYTYETRFRIK